MPEEDPEAKISPVDVLSPVWPPREEFKLDESQYEAFRAALTKQMVVIQGPPGKLIFKHSHHSTRSNFALFNRFMCLIQSI